ncbi:MAG: hypothetical protein RL220_1585 [Bacteroidota bacterium]|jgi:hypothetical protein
MALFACKQPQNIAATEQVSQETTPAEPKDSTFLVYKRTPCFGMCPYFDLTIYQSGYAIYEGKNFVDMIGFYHTKFDKTALQEMMATAERIGYFSLADSYDNPHVTDLPTVTTSVMKDGSLKTVEARYKYPKELEELYQIIDEKIDIQKWTPVKTYRNE